MIKYMIWYMKNMANHTLRLRNSRMRSTRGLRLQPGAALAGLGFEGGVHLLLRQQSVPLGHRAPGVRQHIGPVAQAHPRGSVTHEGLSDGVVAAELVVVEHRDDDLHFLGASWEKKRHHRTTASAA